MSDTRLSTCCNGLIEFMKNSFHQNQMAWNSTYFMQHVHWMNIKFLCHSSHKNRKQQNSFRTTEEFNTRFRMRMKRKRRRTGEPLKWKTCLKLTFYLEFFSHCFSIDNWYSWMYTLVLVTCWTLNDMNLLNILKSIFVLFLYTPKILQSQKGVMLLGWNARLIHVHSKIPSN